MFLNFFLQLETLGSTLKIGVSLVTINMIIFGVFKILITQTKLAYEYSLRINCTNLDTAVFFRVPLHSNNIDLSMLFSASQFLIHKILIFWQTLWYKHMSKCSHFDVRKKFCFGNN